MAKNHTVIEDLIKKLDIEDSNLIIVEDDEDTKKSTIDELKKCFSGDYNDPSENKFYSSKKIETILNDFRRILSRHASDEEVEILKKRVEDIITSNGTGKDSELVDARNGLTSLSTRLQRDIDYADDKYMSKIPKYFEFSGSTIHTGSSGYIDLYVKSLTDSSSNIRLKSINHLKAKDNSNVDQVSYTNDGFVYTQKTSTDNSVTLRVYSGFTKSSLPKGKYLFFANIDFDSIFKDKGNIILAVKNSKDDSAYKEFTYSQDGRFEFEAPKAFDQIKLIFNSNNFTQNAVVRYSNIMLIDFKEEDRVGDKYIPWFESTTPITKNQYIKLYNDDYNISCVDNNPIIRIEYYDNKINIKDIYNDIEELKSSMINNRDNCGLITNYGDYLYFNDSILETETACRVSMDNDRYMRNGVPTLKATFNEGIDINPVFTLKMNDIIETIDSVSICFYIDRTVSYYFTNSKPIRIYLCSDGYNEPEMVNYMYIDIDKKELVQGWNIIKKNINEFTNVKRPNEHSIQYVKVEIAKNAGLDNKSMYLNSIIFNQKMKPTVLLAFDGIYDEGIEYTYPYLTTRNMPATILSNNRTTFTRTILEKIVELRAKYGWDLGQYGCNPNKELLTKDDNAREQYLALKNARTWLNDNLVFNPISYSAPYGNLRPITVPLLKDLGYKIAKTESIGYCNFFDPEYDFAIPMALMSNLTTAEEIIEKIQYAIDNDCCICIYTNNVTNYGDEISAKKVLFESVINFIIDNSDKITPMTFSEFYNKCNK